MANASATAPAASAIPIIDLDDAQDLDDVPDDFFEDFEKNDFLDGLEVLDDLSPRDERDRRRRSLSELSSASSNLGLAEKQTHVLNEIKKLERDIAERRRKLCRTRSPIRSPTNRTRRGSLSRYRRAGRSRSRSRGRRIRSRSRDRRSRSRGRPGRSRIELPSRSRRLGPKSRDKVDATSRKSISFLEELSQKFAEQGKAFPEGEDFDINAMNNYDMRPNPFANAASFPMYNPMMGPQPPQWLNFNNSNMMGSGARGMADPADMQSMMMQTMDQSSVAMDLESPNSNDRMEAPPPPSIVKREYEEPNSRFCDTDEIIRKTFRETVLTRCRDVVNLLKAAETQLVKPPNLYYIPTVISATLPNDTSLSPLQTIHNVEFSFDNEDKAPKYLKRLSQYTSNIVHTLGFNIKTFQFAQQNSSIDDSVPLPDDAVPAEIKFDIGTQTEPLKCVRCLKNDLREFKDKTTQVAAVTYHIGCQTSNEDAYSFSDMTPAQLVAVSDFGKILKGSLMPTNYREATDLRDRLFNIYQTCTGLNKNAFMRDNENRINPAIFCDINNRHPEPAIEGRMVQNDMMRQQDRFDNRQMNIEPQRQFEPSRIDRGDQTFSRPSDSFQSNNTFNSTMNSQDRFMQSNERFDSNMQQSDQFNMMRNSDPRCIPQQQMQRPNDFGSNRMSDSMNMSLNRFDSNQDRFPTMSMNQQQQQPNNMWGQGSSGVLSSLSPISNNSRGGQNDDFARRSAPQPQSLFPETASGVMTCKQIMEMERGRSTQSMNQQNNMQFENNSGGRNMGGGAGVGRGNRGGPQNRSQQQNRSNRGGNGNRF